MSARRGNKDPAAPVRGTNGAKPSHTLVKHMPSSHEDQSGPAKLTPRQAEVVGLLYKTRSKGVTRFECRYRLGIYLPQIVYALRRKGYQILTLREAVGKTWAGRYKLIGEPSA